MPSVRKPPNPMLGDFAYLVILLYLRQYKRAEDFWDNNGP